MQCQTLGESHQAAALRAAEKGGALPTGETQQLARSGRAQMIHGFGLPPRLGESM